MQEIIMIIASPLLIGLAAYIMGGASIKEMEEKTKMPERRERTAEDFYNDLTAKERG